MSVTADEHDMRSVIVAVDGQETRLVFVESSSFASPHMAPVGYVIVMLLSLRPLACSAVIMEKTLQGLL